MDISRDAVPMVAAHVSTPGEMYWDQDAQDFGWAVNTNRDFAISYSA